MLSRPARRGLGRIPFELIRVTLSDSETCESAAELIRIQPAEGYNGGIKFLHIFAILSCLSNVPSCYNPIEFNPAAACFLSFPTIRAKRALSEEHFSWQSPTSAPKQ
jgi:hypothetical protein